MWEKKVETNQEHYVLFDFPFFNVYITSLDSLCIDCKSPDIEQGQSPNSGPHPSKAAFDYVTVKPAHKHLGFSLAHDLIYKISR